MKEFFTGLFKKKNTKRIWELDAFRGLCIIGVVIVHAIFDIRELFGFYFETPAWFDWIQTYGGILFVVLSGVCVTLGHHHIIRGVVVAVCAMIITLVTCLLFDRSLHIWFGVLHLLAFCMLTYGLYRKLPWPVILGLGVCFVALGIWFTTFKVSNPYLFPLGLTAKGFAAGDYFPIFPHLGYFMIGVAGGKTLYKNKVTLFKKVNDRNPVIRFFSFVGRHSLLIYMLHQPLVYGILFLISRLVNRAA